MHANVPTSCTVVSFVFFNDTATTEISTLSLHDALPISTASGRWRRRRSPTWPWSARQPRCPCSARWSDRKSTRLNSSHVAISYAVFCLKKKKVNDRLDDADQLEFVE